MSFATKLIDNQDAVHPCFPMPGNSAIEHILSRRVGRELDDGLPAGRGGNVNSWCVRHMAHVMTGHLARCLSDDCFAGEGDFGDAEVMLQRA